jgi:2-octaprenyl-6-methoxyphenol hydroxylase
MQNITIIGAGLTGIAMACSLAQHGLNVTVIESADLSKINAKESDGRTCAISYGSTKIFEQMGVWTNMQKHAGPILDIRITDGDSPLFLHYDHKLVGDNPMGYIVENYHIRKTLFAKATTYKNLTILDSTRYTDIKRNNSGVTITTDTGKTIRSQLLIAADGRGSKVRQLAGIKTTSWSYEQSAIVCTVKHQQKHEGVAVEKFLPAGPFAILPMHDQNYSSIVWTEPSHLAQLYIDMSNEDFTQQLSTRFDGYLGKLQVVGNKFSHPLGLVLARKYTDTRLALIGDAAHAMHPIAGQGFNLGIRDIPVLTNAIIEAKNLGLDIGSDDVLHKYAATRKFDNISLLAITDSLNRLFSNNIFPIKYARRLGIAAVNKIPTLKKIFVRHAMGEVDYT